MDPHFPAPVPVIDLNGVPVRTGALPAGLRLEADLGLVVAGPLAARLVHRTATAGGQFECRAVVTPAGDYLLMFPEGGHYAHAIQRTNRLVAYRSSDRGRTWQGPSHPVDLDYGQHGFIPLVPRDSRRIYQFGTQPEATRRSFRSGHLENAAIGFRSSDDDGRTWSGTRFIQPVNDPGYLGMSVMRMTETPAGTWILGTHEAFWHEPDPRFNGSPVSTRAYLLRSTDAGQTWELVPGRRPGGWRLGAYDRMDEPRPIAIGDEVLVFLRTPAGRLWLGRSFDDGATWAVPEPTPLVHPDAPPMVFPLGDGRTLAAFHHNRRSADAHFAHGDRRELWVSLSRDLGRTWDEPRFVLANALPETHDGDQRWFNHACSYLDGFADQGELHLFLPHRWRQVVHLVLPEAALAGLPLRSALA